MSVVLFLITGFKRNCYKSHVDVETSCRTQRTDASSGDSATKEPKNTASCCLARNTPSLLSQPDEMSVVVLLSLQQLRVSPLHERIQVGAGWGGHGDQVSIGPDLQTHQGDEGPQRLVGLGGASQTNREKGNICSARHFSEFYRVWEFSQN